MMRGQMQHSINLKTILNIKKIKCPRSNSQDQMPKINVFSFECPNGATANSRGQGNAAAPGNVTRNSPSPERAQAKIRADALSGLGEFLSPITQGYAFAPPWAVGLSLRWSFTIAP